MEYNGITRESLFLLADNRFRDSKAFYEEHKEEIKAGITVPLRQIAAIFGEELLAVDPLINTIPTKMVSRIRRDTRFTKDKSLYREHAWVMFMRPKDSWRCYPCMWFEISPTEYAYGIGFYGEETGLLEKYRKALREKTAEFKKAVKSCESAGAKFSANMYKRPFPDCPKGLENFYNCKNFFFMKTSGDLDDIKDEKIIGILREAYKAFTPMYKFLLAISDEYFSKEE